VPIKEVLRKTIKVLKQTKVRYALTGGIAVDFYGFPRATFDIDVMVELSKENLPRLVSSLQKGGFRVHPSEVKVMQEKGNRFVAHLGPYRIDFWLARTEAQKEELDRAKMVTILGMRARLIAPEDLIIHKLEAGRGKDYDDVVGVLVRQKGKINMEYLKQRAAALGLNGCLRELLREAGMG